MADIIENGGWNMHRTCGTMVHAALNSPRIYCPSLCALGVAGRLTLAGVLSGDLHMARLVQVIQREAILCVRLGFH